MVGPVSVVRSGIGAAAAGGLLVLAFPPVRLGLVAIPAVALFLWSVRNAGGSGRATLNGAVFGLVFFSALFPWIGELGLIALVPLVVSQAAFTTAYALLLHRASAWPPGRWALAAGGGWAAMELVRERFPVGGFPWGMLGYTFGDLGWIRGSAQWIGTSGLSLVVAFGAASLVVASRSRGPLLAAGLVTILLTFGGWLDPALPGGVEAKVAIVQGSTPCPGDHCPDERFQTYQSHLALTASLLAGQFDLVVWPEGSTGGSRSDPVLHPEVGAAIGEQARRLGAYLLVGGDRPLNDREWVNANVLFNPEGEIVDEYRKRHPVPFGEYVPARPLFTWVDELAAVPRDMIRGPGAKVFQLDFGRVGSVISFEGSFARYARDTVAQGAGLLVVATNEGSYPYSAASDQLIGMTRMRAAELGIDIVHAAVTGRSALITNGGIIGPTTGLATAEVLTGTVRLRSGGPTFYTRFGEWVPLVAVAALAVSISRGKRAGGHPKAAPDTGSR